mmetsp:Transcript_51009/g.116117  ORF Transcript_51009/g.116117 Transcript_51009/m.116117 type:complete len:181 (+) Transcript_51009:23-565(+)
MAHFSDQGVHCAHEYCRMKDFLPFECDACKKQYCVSHATYDSHGCTAVTTKDKRAIVCPVCGDSIKLPEGMDPNVIWEAHSRNGRCNAEKLQAKKRKCPVQGCREKLTTSGSIVCSKCKVRICMKHRYEDAHQCGTLKPAPLPDGQWECTQCTLLNQRASTTCGACRAAKPSEGGGCVVQ